MGIGDSKWYEKAVMELDSALNKWLDSVPEHRRLLLSVATQYCCWRSPNS